MRLRQFPVLNEFIPMLTCPFNYQSQGPWRKASAKYRKCANVELSHVLSIDGMKMRRIVIVVVHADNYAVKPA